MSTGPVSNPILLTDVAEGFSSATLTNQMAEFFKRQAEQRTQSIQTSYDTDLNSIERISDRWEDVRSDIESAKNILSNMAGRVKSLRTSINNMISNVNKAEQNAEEGTGAEIYSSAFDALLKGVDDAAQRGSAQGLNLLSSTKSSLEYKVGINGGYETVNSAYVGSSYYVVDDDGKYWALDRAAKTLKRYDNFPDEPTNTVGNFQTGVQLDDLTGDSITFTIAPDTASPQTFSGTIYRSGLDILDSWGYDGLTTSEGRARALEDLNTAKAALDLEIRRYEVSLSTASFYQSMADQAIDGYRDETNTLMIEQAKAIQEEQDKLSREYQVSTNSVAQALSMQNGYSKMLSSALYEGSFAQKLVNILA